MNLIATGRKFIKRFRREGTARIVLCLLLLLSLYLLTAATENSALFGRLYVWLLLLNIVVLVALIALIARNLWRLLRALRAGRSGSRLTARLMALFVLLAMVPGLVVYAFSMQFLRSGIDSWFDVRVEAALNDALELSQASLDLRMRDMLRRVQAASRALVGVPDGLMALTLSDLREQMEATELTLLGSNARIVAASSEDTDAILPHRPDDEILLQLAQGRPYVSLDPIENEGLHIRAAVPAPNPATPGNSRILQALFPISPRLNELAEGVERAFGEYQELTYLRGPLKDSFSLALSLVLLLSVMFAVWSAFFLARRLVAPISGLVEGTRAVAEGDYGTQLPPAGRDELGFLVRSFNEMSRRVAQARDAARRGQVQVEAQRAYLETVLGRLSSGVLALDRHGRLRTYNQAADHILSVQLNGAVGSSLAQVAERQPEFAPFAELVGEWVAAGTPEWREELTLDTAEGRRVLICSGAALPGGRAAGGHVIVFDDVTTLIQAQRDAAWGEVARRLAHEIRNPLTPIQLSAERLQHKFGDRLEAGDAEMLSRSTRTIIQQVDTLKAMVKAFSEYARPPVLDIRPLELNALIQDVAELYRGGGEGVDFELALDPALPALHADTGRLRQLLNNLLRNAMEAARAGARCRVRIETRRGEERFAGMVELRVSDDGPGFAPEVLNQLFEPYVTTKPRGTGLGLPIVKKIVEEHNGRIHARNLEHGACVIVRFPVPGRVIRRERYARVSGEDS